MWLSKLMEKFWIMPIIDVGEITGFEIKVQFKIYEAISWQDGLLKNQN